MRNFIFILALGYLIIACSSQNTILENRDISEFTGIEACCGIDVYLSEGETSSVEIKAPEDLAKKVKTEVNNGVLKISLKNGGRAFSKGKVEAYVSVKELSSVKASSGSKIISKTALTSEDVRLSASSGSDIKLELDAGSLNCNTSSGSAIVLKGSSEYAKLSASSGSDIKLKEMEVKKVEAEASSGSDIIVTVQDEIKARVSSGADIRYYGNPIDKDVSSSSGGSIKKKSKE